MDVQFLSVAIRTRRLSEVVRITHVICCIASSCGIYIIPSFVFCFPVKIMTHCMVLFLVSFLIC